MDLALATIIGSIGGLLRALVGSRKAMLKKKPFVLSYFLFTVMTAAVIGAVLGFVVGTTPLLALAVGYAGTDFLEGIAKAARLVSL